MPKTSAPGASFFNIAAVLSSCGVTGMATHPRPTGRLSHHLAKPLKNDRPIALTLDRPRIIPVETGESDGQMRSPRYSQLPVITSLILAA